MPIVFDHVEGHVQQAADPAAADEGTPPPATPAVSHDPEQLARELERVQRRRQRLEAD